MFLRNADRLRSSTLGEDYSTGNYFLARRGTGCAFPMSRDGGINANFWWPMVESGQEGARTMAASGWIEFSATVLRCSSTRETASAAFVPSV